MSGKLKPEKIPVFILAGGQGTRISEESLVRPKPMIEIGGIPILIHIMNSYYAHGFQDFVICAGYLSWQIKEYFLNYSYRTHGLMIDTRSNKNVVAPYGKGVEEKKWRVRVLETGSHAMTGSRLAQALDAVGSEDRFDHFALTYGDGLTDANLTHELEFHAAHGGIGTVLGVASMARFGELRMDRTKVTGFVEKPQDSQGLVSGGFFFFKREFRKYVTEQENCVLERMPLETLASEGQLHVHEHRGFWHCMDTLRDKIHLQKLWDDANAPWIRAVSVPSSNQRKSG